MGESRKLEASSNPVSTFLKNHLEGIKRLQYAFIIIPCTVVLAFQVAKCAEKYINKNTGWKFYNRMELKLETCCDLDQIGCQTIQIQVQNNSIAKLFLTSRM